MTQYITVYPNFVQYITIYPNHLTKCHYSHFPRCSWIRFSSAPKRTCAASSDGREAGQRTVVLTRKMTLEHLNYIVIAIQILFG